MLLFIVRPIAFWSSSTRYSTRVLGAALTRARRVGVADRCDACTDWLTDSPEFGQISPTNVADRFFKSATFLSRRRRYSVSATKVDECEQRESTGVYTC